MPEPKVGDELRWHDHSEWRILETPIPSSGYYKYIARAVCIGDTHSTMSAEGTRHDIVFQQETVEASGWQYIEDDFTRWVKETRAASGVDENQIQVIPK